MPGQPAIVAPRAGVFVDYRRLMQVSIRHEYFTPPESGGALFRVIPTDRTLARMRVLGLQVRAQGDGFFVGCDTAQPWAARTRPGAGDEPLSFMLVPNSPHFVSMTDMDLDTSSRATPFYFSNRVLAGEPQPEPAGTTGSTDRAAVGQALGGVRLRAQLRSQPLVPGRLVQPARAFQPTPMCVVDLFPSDAHSGGASPMFGADADSIRLVRYEIVFEARRTFWKYHIVPQPSSGPLDHLSIDASLFLGPFDEMLANGVRAQRFLSKAPIALASHSSVRFSLSGRRKERMTRDAVLMDRLPAAGVPNALLSKDDLAQVGVSAGDCSEMFVYV